VRELLVYSRFGRVALALVATLGFAFPAAAAGVLFPKPLHIVRRLEDPIAHRTSVVDEYCSGNRVVSINGRKVVITDYDQQQITEIDHDRGTYSITRFEDVAKVQPKTAAKRSEWKTTPLGMKSSAAGRSIDAFTFETNTEATRERRRVEVGVDRQVSLSREAVEVLVGAAYPSQPSEEHEQLLQAAKAHGGRMTTNGAQSPAEYGLPSETTLTYDSDRTHLTYRNSIVHISDDAPPAELLVIAPGAERIESRLTRAAREMRELDFPTKP